MIRYLTRCLCTIFLCLSLAACLPGKKREEKVIALASEATQSVQADKLAADMEIAARQFKSGGGTPGTVNSNLTTIACGDKYTIAYIPKTAQIVQNNTLPPRIAQRLSDQLKTNFKPEDVVQAKYLAACGSDPELVAINSPVLRLELTSAELAAKPASDIDVVTVDMAPCPNDAQGHRVPGVIVTKTSRDKSKHIENHCGKAAPDESEMPNIELSDNMKMPDWKRRLTGKNADDIAASANFTCIVDKQSKECKPMTTAAIGGNLECQNAVTSNSYLINPVYNPVTSKFESSTSSLDCGKGWSGKLVTRVKQSVCTITRSGVQQQPATTFELVNVAARCTKNDVKNIATSCPAGGSGNFFAAYDKVDMIAPVLLEPQAPGADGKTQSLIALPGFQPSAADLTGIKTALNTGITYTPSVNLRAVSSDDKFSTKIVQDMGNSAKLYNIKTCNIAGNTCGAGADQVVIILDRSSSMGSADPADQVSVAPSMGKLHACKAGLKNIFQTSLADSACGSAKTFVHDRHKNAQGKMLDYIAAPWAGGAAPTGNALVQYQNMENALIDKEKYRASLQLALDTGWDCSGRALTGSSAKEIFPTDMFGTCSGAQSCDSCPGECVDATPVAVPASLESTRIDAAGFILRQIANMKLKPNTKITLADLVNDVSALRTITFCPPERQNSAGICDMKLERDNLIATMIRPADSTTYIKPVSQEVTIPTDDISSAAAPDNALQCEGANMVHMSGGIGIPECYNFPGGVYCAPDLSVDHGTRTYDLKALASYAGLNANDSYENLAAAFKGDQAKMIAAAKDYERANQQSPPNWPLDCSLTGGHSAVTGNCAKDCLNTSTAPVSEPWKTWQQAESDSTYTDSAPDPSSSYEYRSCVTFDWSSDEYDCGYGGVPGACGRADAERQRSNNYFASGKHPWQTGPSIVGASGGNSGTYCEERHKKDPINPNPWETYQQAQTNGSYDGHNNVDPDKYEYDDCRTDNQCSYHELVCIDLGRDPSYPECTSAASCFSTLLDQPVVPSGGSSPYYAWPAVHAFLKEASKGPYTGMYEGPTYTFCNKRRLKPASPALTTCLDKCDGLKVTATTNIESCRSAPNLFTGVTATNCASVAFPTKVTYSPTGYTGATEVKTVTRYVGAKKDDADAIAVSGSTPVMGADYGGNTPLMATIDKVLGDADIAKNMSDKKNMAFIVLTDGMDTGDGTTATKDLCGATDSLASALAANPNAKARFISLNNLSLVNTKCATSQPAAYVSASRLFDAETKIGEILGGSTGNLSDPVEATKFCVDHFGAYYEDHDVPNASGITSGPAICRAYEVDQ